MTKSTPFFATTLCLLLGTATFAQGTAAPAADAPAANAAADAAAAPVVGTTAAADGLSMGTEAGTGAAAAPQFTDELFGTWTKRCDINTENPAPCQLYHLLKDSDGTSVAEISLFGLPQGQQAAAGATVIVPLETLLTADLVLAVDTGKARNYPFAWCSPAGCIARIGFTQAEVDGFKKGNEAKLTIVPAVAPDQKVELTVPLTGFTAGYDAVNAANGN
ncbi:Invasion protein IalB, involved in pathogenesis [Pseudorhodobacter antarcticus]|uniref:Invasion protein IalB, involved in pathogenesis n=1 Tax=Pseudorhodobacter antarcticus TaxID=1077947 RepID=A0A1H8JVA8_9RHOB|nr:invasion associated locus B family protein [Pseudorhodobacter antarcticus]SEN84629.1 Invasion protein IalB, involved in pathogenesis [Pseudorhodobacter antarcticus]